MSISQLEPLSERLYDELGERADIAIDVINSFVTSNKGSKLVRLPSNITLKEDGTVTFGEGRGDGPSSDIDGLFESIDLIFQTALKYDKVSWAIDSPNGTSIIPFVKFGNSDKLIGGHITFRVVNGQAGAFGKGVEMAPSARQYTPALRDVVPDPDIADSEIFILSQRKDYYIELCAHGRTAHEVDMVRSWIERTISNNLWYLKHSGVIEFHFSMRLTDTYRTIDGQAEHARPLKYYVAIEELSWYRYQMLKELCLTLHLAP